MRTNSDHYEHRARAVGGMVLIALSLVAVTRQMSAQEATGDEKQAVVTVEGMQCPFCAYGIKKHLGKLPGATRVDVDLGKNQATVTFEAGTEVTDEDIEEAIDKAGFTPGDITWQSDEREKRRTGRPAATVTRR